MFGVQVSPKTPLGGQGESRTCRSQQISPLHAAGAGIWAGEGGVRKAIPAALRISGPTLRAPISAGGGERPSQGHLCPSVPPSQPLPWFYPRGLSLLEDPFRHQGVAVPYDAMQGWRGHGGRVTISLRQPSLSFPHRLFPVQASRGILWHTEPWHELSVPAAVPQGAVTSGERVPRQPTALPAPTDRREIWGGQGQRKLWILWEVRSPRGAGQGLLSNASGLLGTMQGMNKGSPGVTLQGGCPWSLPEPTGPAGRGPGADVTLGWQQGEGLGPATEGAGASLPATRRAAPSDSPVQLLGHIFSLWRTHRGC